MTKHSTHAQPASQATMDLYDAYHLGNEKRPQQEQQLDHEHSGCKHNHGLESNSPSHKSCHSDRMKKLLVPAALIALAFIALMAWSCFDMMGIDSMGGGEFVSGLVRRQSAGEPTGEGGRGLFIENKYYLIVIFVGLFLCLVAGIFLSIWCCKGAFQNPLCCPCYLCACCGGLACLQCLSCGLCCEGVDQIGYE